MAQDRILWAIESPSPASEDEVLIIAFQHSGATAVTNPVSHVFKNGIEYSDDVFLSGDSDAVSGQIQTAKRITVKAGDFGQAYVVVFEADVDGQHELRYWQFDIHRKGQEM